MLNNKQVFQVRQSISQDNRSNKLAEYDGLTFLVEVAEGACNVPHNETCLLLCEVSTALNGLQQTATTHLLKHQIKPAKQHSLVRLLNQSANKLKSQIGLYVGSALEVQQLPEH